MEKRIEQDDFIKLFENVKSHCADLNNIDENLVKEINTNVYKDRSNSKTITYIYSSIGATLFFFIYPFLIYWLYNSINTITAYFVSLTNIGLFENKTTLNVSLIISTFALLSYAFLIPSPKLRSWPSFVIFNIFSNINLKHQKYYIFAITSSYFIFGSILLILFINFPYYSSIINNILTIYLLVPIALILFFLLIMIIATVVILPFNKFIDNYQHSRNKNIEITYEILSLLSKYNEYEKIHLIKHETYTLMLNKLNHINYLIENIPIDYGQGISKDYALNTFKQVALNFQDNIKEMLVPNEKSIEKIRSSLLQYLKYFIIGNLSELPKKEATDNVEIHKIKESSYVLGVIFLIGYLFVPIIAFLIIESHLKLELNELTQSLLKIAYIIWALLGIITNKSILNEESKTLVKDIIQTIFVRK